MPIQESGHLNFINRGEKFQSFFDVLFVDGHTEAQMIPHIKYKDKTIIFAADLSSTGHIPLAYVMGYDVQPLKTLDEKVSFYWMQQIITILFSYSMIIIIDVVLSR